MAAKKKATSPKPTKKSASPSPAPQPPLKKTLPAPRELHRLGSGLAALAAVTGSSKFFVSNLPTLWTFRLDRGNGDELLFFVSPAGYFARGIDHEAPRSPYEVGHIWPGTFAGLPHELESLASLTTEADAELFADAPAGKGKYPASTFVAWGLPGAEEWTRGALAEGAPESGEDFLVSCLDPSIDFEGLGNVLVAKALRNESLTDAELAKHVKGAGLERVRGRLESAGYGKPLPFS